METLGHCSCVSTFDLRKRILKSGKEERNNNSNATICNLPDVSSGDLIFQMWINFSDD